MSRRSLIGTGLALVFMAGGLIWLLSSPALVPPADSGQGEMDGMEMPGMEQPRTPDASRLTEEL